MISREEFQRRKRACLAEFGRVYEPIPGHPDGRVYRWMHTMDDLRLNWKATLLAGQHELEGADPAPVDLDAYCAWLEARNPGLLERLSS